MGTRLFIALAALGAVIGLVAVRFLVQDTAVVHAAGVASSTELDPVGSRFKSTQPVPTGYSVLIVKTLLHGEPYEKVSVTVRGDTAPRRAREDTEAWAYFLPSKSATFLDITDEESGWTQTETTLAPVAGDVRTLTVDLSPPEIDGEVQLQVRSSTDDEPIAGARVIAISEDPPDIVMLDTDGRGSVRVPRGPHFTYTIDASGYCAATLPAFTDSMKPFQVVELDAQARLFGRLLSQDKGIAQVQLLMEDIEAETGRRMLASATVDRNGDWSMEGLNVPKGQKSIDEAWLEVYSSGTSRSLKSDLHIEPGMNLEVIDPWIDGIPITLEFVYPSGRTVSAGSTVFLRREATREVGAGQTLGGVTDAQGRISFPALSVSQWACEIGAVKLPALEVTGDPVQTVLVEGFDCIAGDVRWAGSDDRDLSDVRVSLLIGSKSTVQGVRSNSSVQGRPSASFQFDFVPASSTGTITAHLLKGGFYTGEGSEHFGSGDPIHVAAGSADVIVTLARIEDPSQRKIPRRSGGVPVLNFDK